MKISSLLKVGIFHPEQQKASDDLFLARMKHVHTAMSFPWEWLRTEKRAAGGQLYFFFPQPLQVAAQFCFGFV